MNYTENYHLPQWDETDRIMRVDFNDAMEQLEAGLTGGVQVSEELRQSGQKTVDRLCRLAYNHYCAVRDMSPFPYQAGVFYQNPARERDGVTGAMLWDGICFAGKSEETLSPEVLQAGFERLTPLVMVKGQLAECEPMTARLQVPASGVLRRFSFTGNFYENVPDTPARFLLTLTNQETGAVEHSEELNLALNFVSASLSYYPVDISFPILGGVEYLLTLRPLEAVYTANNAGIYFSTHGRADTYANAGIITASRILRELAGGERGAVVLRCMITGEGGTLTLTWDGVERQPDAQRLVRAKDGRIVQEFIYYRDKAIPENSQMSLHFVCNEGGNFVFYDWGATLL